MLRINNLRVRSFMRSVATLVLAGAWLAQAAEPSISSRPPVASDQAVRIELLPKSNGPALRIAGVETLVGTSPQLVDGVTVQGQNGSLLIQTGAKDARVSSAAMPGWACYIPQNVSGIFEFDLKLGRITAKAPERNLKPIYLLAEPGGHAELRAGSEGSLELFPNGSYLLRGKGKAYGVNADGKTVALSDPGASVTGGRANAEKATGAAGRRVTSELQVTFEGVVGKDLRIKAGEASVDMQDGPRQTLEIPSLGASIEFEEALSLNAVRFRVIKGDVRLSINGIKHWQGKVQTGHSGLLSWTLGDRTIDLKNLSSESIVVLLPREAIAEITPGATFQYSLMMRREYSAAASGAPVRLYSKGGQYSLDLQVSNQLISFVPDEAARRKPGLPLYLNWDTGGPLAVSSSAAYANVNPGTDQVIKFGEEGAVALNYSEGGLLKTEAINANFLMVIEALNGLHVNLEAGDSVSMILDRRKGTFTVQAGEENAFLVGVDTQNGFAPDLGASRALNFNIKKDGAVMATAGVSFVYYAPGARELYSPKPDESIISDTINQTPVSVVSGPVLNTAR